MNAPTKTAAPTPERVTKTNTTERERALSEEEMTVRVAPVAVSTLETSGKTGRVPKLKSRPS